MKKRHATKKEMIEAAEWCKHEAEMLEFSARMSSASTNPEFLMGYAVVAKQSRRYRLSEAVLRAVAEAETMAVTVPSDGLILQCLHSLGSLRNPLLRCPRDMPVDDHIDLIARPVVEVEEP